MSNRAAFELSIAKFVEKAKAAPELVIRKLSIEILTRVVMRSPVGNPDLWQSAPPPGYVGGRFRANWYVTIGQPSNESSEEIDKGGQTTIARGSSEIAMARSGEAIFIVNNLPYAWPLERGHSTQAPVGMVGITVAEFNALADKAANEVRAGQ